MKNYNTKPCDDFYEKILSTSTIKRGSCFISFALIFSPNIAVFFQANEFSKSTRNNVLSYFLPHTYGFAAWIILMFAKKHLSKHMYQSLWNSIKLIYCNIHGIFFVNKSIFWFALGELPSLLSSVSSASRTTPNRLYSTSVTVLYREIHIQAAHQAYLSDVSLSYTAEANFLLLLPFPASTPNYMNTFPTRRLWSFPQHKLSAHGRSFSHQRHRNCQRWIPVEILSYTCPVLW